MKFLNIFKRKEKPIKNYFIVKISDFTKMPGGRYKKDGPGSGEEFRNDILVPALIDNEYVLVDLKGCVGFGSSFLQEAFGKLDKHGFSIEELKNKLEFSDDNIYAKEIWQYINREY